MALLLGVSRFKDLLPTFDPEHLLGSLALSPLRLPLNSNQISQNMTMTSSTCYQPLTPPLPPRRMWQEVSGLKSADTSTEMRSQFAPQGIVIQGCAQVHRVQHISLQILLLPLTCYVTRVTSLSLSLLSC